MTHRYPLRYRDDMVLFFAFSILTKAYLFCYKPGSLTNAGEGGRGLIRDPRCRLLTLRGRVPHQPRVEGFGGEHRQHDDAAKGERTDPGLDRDDRADGD